MDSLQVAIWVLGGAIGVIGILVGVLWNMTRAEQKAQDEAIAKKADLHKVDDAEKRWEKEVDRLRFEHDKVIDRVENRFEKELENMENRLCTKIETMEENLVRQIGLVMELLRKEKV